MSQNKLTPTVIGIDIGAHSAKIAAVQRAAIQIITNEANFRETPSIVGYGEGERKIGEAGNVKLKSNFKNTIVSPMRYLALADPSQQLIFNSALVKNEKNELLFKVKDFNNKQLFLEPEQTLASYLTHLNKIILENGLDAKLITIAIPSYFTEMEKQAVLNAVEISQMNSKVNLVEQNIAVGLDYGVFKKNEIEKNQNGKTVCFVDFGHSKLSATVIKYSGDKMEVLMQKNARNTGCRNIDMKLFEHYAKIFQEKQGLDLKENKKACLKLLEVIQRQRKILSGIHESDISIECLMEDEDINEPISRKLISQIAQSVFDEMKKLLSELKQEADKKQIKLDEVELVGGGTRIPAVIEIVHEIFGMAPSRTINSSQCIAKGATLASVQKSGLFRLHTFKVSKKLNHNIRMSLRKLDSEMEDENLSEYREIFNKEEFIPSEKKMEINEIGKIELSIQYEHPDKEALKQIMNVSFEIKKEEPINEKSPELEVEEEKGEEKGEMEIQTEKQEKQLKPEIIFEINSNGFLNIKKISYGEKDIPFKVNKVYSLQERQLQEFKSLERSMFLKDYEIVKSYEKKNELESSIYKQKQIMNSELIAEYLSPEEKEKYEKFFNELGEALNDDSLTVKDYEAKAAEVEKIFNEAKNLAASKKQQISQYFNELEKLKKAAVDTLNHISSKYRNTRAVSQAYNEIKEVHDWAVEAIQKSKKSKISELPLVKNESIERQHNIIKESLNSIMNPRQGPSQQQQYMGSPFSYHESPRYQPEQRRRMNTHQNYDPFGMSRSAFFPSNNFFGGFF